MVGAGMKGRREDKLKKVHAGGERRADAGIGRNG